MVGFPFGCGCETAVAACLPLSGKGERKRDHEAMCRVLSLRPLDAAIMSAICMVDFPLAASAVAQLLLSFLPLSAKGERKRGHGAMCHVLSLRLDTAKSANCMVGSLWLHRLWNSCCLPVSIYLVLPRVRLCAHLPVPSRDQPDVVCHLVGRGCGMCVGLTPGSRPSMTARVMG